MRGWDVAMFGSGRQHNFLNHVRDPATVPQNRWYDPKNQRLLKGGLRHGLAMFFRHWSGLKCFEDVLIFPSAFKDSGLL